MLVGTQLVGFGAGVGGFPLVKTTATTSIANVDSHVVDLPAGVVSGDLLVIVFVIGQNRSITWPGGWTALNEGSIGQLKLATAYRVADGTEGATITVTLGNPAQGAHMAYRISGYKGTPENGVAATGTSTSPDPPGLSPSWGSSSALWLAAIAFKSSTASVSSFPTNYTNGLSLLGGGGSNPCLGASARRAQAAASEDPGSFVVDESENWIANTIAIQG